MKLPSYKFVSLPTFFYSRTGMCFLHVSSCLGIFHSEAISLEVISPVPQSEAHPSLSSYNFHYLKSHKITTVNVKFWKYSEHFFYCWWLWPSTVAKPLWVLPCESFHVSPVQRGLPCLLEAVLEQWNPNQVSTLHYCCEIHKVNKYFVLMDKKQTEDWQRLRTWICKASKILFVPWNHSLPTTYQNYFSLTFPPLYHYL